MSATQGRDRFLLVFSKNPIYRAVPLRERGRSNSFIFHLQGDNNGFYPFRQDLTKKGKNFTNS